MSHVKVQTKVSLTFELSEDVAHWLRSLMQNPIYEDESAEENKYRKLIFEAINKPEYSVVCREGQFLFNSHRDNSIRDDEIPF